MVTGMDVNLTMLKGRLAVPPLVEYTADGAKQTRMLVLVRSDRRYRFDVLPVVSAGPGAAMVEESLPSGTTVVVSGSLMRRCSPGHPARIEVVADAIGFPDVGTRRSAG